ncbi:bifunctional nuclease family protein [Seleniivibrio woodruffii]|uniref:bifunctional nuclease family protein n=1 Tax=Seleniivibrio woodruffii TaxID=1078050 RepID=UPI0026F33F5C|nr:bifunctional nuclease domain-containing protein [Seleniivibrio woodruffii]
MYEVKVYNVIREPLTSRYLLILDSVDMTEESVLIPIGKYEAENIHSRKCTSGRCKKSAYDMLSPILDSVESVTFDKLVIDNCDCGIYKANLFMTSGGNDVKIDCRPSDGVILAMDRKIPIYVKHPSECCEINN